MANAMLERIDDWNRRYPIGTDVVVRKDSGELLRTQTRSEADIAGGGTPIIWVDGIIGCCDLDLVSPVEPR